MNLFQHHHKLLQLLERDIADHQARNGYPMASTSFHIVLEMDKIWNMVATLLPVRYLKQKAMYSMWKDLPNKGKDGKQIVEERVDYVEIAYSSFKFKKPVNPTVLTDSDLQSLKVLLLHLIGANETMYDANSAISRLNKVAPRIGPELISDTGHDRPFTHAELVNQRILKFLKI